MPQKLKFILFNIFLPLMLFVLGTYSLFSYLKASEFGITNLDIHGKAEGLVATHSGELLAGDKVWGKFHSQFTNLGIISLRFFNQNRDSDDTLLFRLKESGTDNWIYSAKYETNQFQPHKYFPFGFPVIHDSADKNYEFEIESLRGATGSGIIVEKISPYFIGKSAYPKSELVSNRNLLTYFLINKFTNVFGDSDTRINIFYFYLPLLLYIFFITSAGMSFQFLVGVVIILSVYDVFFQKETFDFLYLSIIFFWGLISKRYRFESRVAAVIALTNLALVPFMLILGQDGNAEKLAIWAYLFLCITVVQQIFELKHKPKNMYTIKHVAEDMFQLTFDRSRVGNKFIAGIFSPLAYLFSGMILYGIFQTVAVSQNAYQVFYASSFTKTFLVHYLLPVLAITAIFIFLLFRIHKAVKLNIFLILLVLIAYRIFFLKADSVLTEFKLKPTIFSINPSVVTEAWTDVVITGMNFRDIPFVGKVYVGGLPQTENVYYWSDSKIIFRTAPNLSKTGDVQVLPLDRPATNKIPFKYLFR